jgi:type I restriction enzyme, S subunit
MVSDWVNEKLGKVVKYANGASFPNEYQGSKEEKYDFYKVSDMNNPLNKTYMTHAENSISEETVQLLKGKVHPPYTVIFPKVGAALLTNKRRILSKPSLFDNNVMGLVATEKIKFKYLYYFLQTIDFAKYVQSGAVPSINKTIVDDIDIFLPPLREQSKVASILSSVDEAIEKTASLIKQTEKVKKGLMQQLLTKGIGHTKFRRTEVGEIPDGWEVVALGEIADFINGRGFKPHEWSTRGLPIIRIQNLNGSKEFNYYEGEFNPKILVEPETLLFAWSGSRGTSFGPHIWKGPNGVLNYHTWKVLNNDRVLKQFLYYSLKKITTKIENDSHGASALVHMQKSAMENYKIALPDFAEQEKIAVVLLTMDSKLANECRMLEQLQILKKGLMQSLITGKVRVKVDEVEVMQV